MKFALLCSCAFLVIGGHGQSVMPNYPWPVYHQRYIQTGFCEYSFLLSVQNSEGVCLLPANVSTRLQEIERDRTLEKQSMKQLSSSLGKLSEQVHNLTLDVKNTSAELTKLAEDQAEIRARDEEMARDLDNVTHSTETTRKQIQEIELMQEEQKAAGLELEQTLEQQNQTIDELKTLVHQQSQDLNDLKNLVEQQSDVINQYETRLSHLESGKHNNDNRTDCSLLCIQNNASWTCNRSYKGSL
ncbi:Hypp7393 [Branchiostoma lanceolatum]|uniref:Hypp7393 protein n=1 Tax=Branchiostoma lanceolatum TaxID=7740 RepID=A0A8K0EDA7_BRALA|nr:Hypp7393 [Branchiostoma lanceolatum]